MISDAVPSAATSGVIARMWLVVEQPSLGMRSAVAGWEPLPALLVIALALTVSSGIAGVRVAASAGVAVSPGLAFTAPAAAGMAGTLLAVVYLTLLIGVVGLCGAYAVANRLVFRTTVDLPVLFRIVAWSLTPLALRGVVVGTAVLAAGGSGLLSFPWVLLDPFPWWSALLVHRGLTSTSSTLGPAVRLFIAVPLVGHAVAISLSVLMTTNPS